MISKIRRSSLTTTIGYLVLTPLDLANLGSKLLRPSYSNHAARFRSKERPSFTAAIQSSIVTIFAAVALNRPQKHWKSCCLASL